MKKLTISLLLNTLLLNAHAQQKTIDSLLLRLDRSKDVKEDNSRLDKILAIPHGELELIKKVKQDFTQAERRQNASKQLRALLIIANVEFTLHNTPGLSLSYDIVVKGHGGSITVDTTEGEGSAFTIYLPII